MIAIKDNETRNAKPGRHWADISVESFEVTGSNVVEQSSELVLPFGAVAKDCELERWTVEQNELDVGNCLDHLNVVRHFDISAITSTTTTSVNIDWPSKGWWKEMSEQNKTRSSPVGRAKRNDAGSNCRQKAQPCQPNNYGTFLNCCHYYGIANSILT